MFKIERNVELENKIEELKFKNNINSNNDIEAGINNTVQNVQIKKLF
jgi:hypothetical protein